MVNRPFATKASIARDICHTLDCGSLNFGDGNRALRFYSEITLRKGLPDPQGPGCKGPSSGSVLIRVTCGS